VKDVLKAMFHYANEQIQDLNVLINKSVILQ